MSLTSTQSPHETSQSTVTERSASSLPVAASSDSEHDNSHDQEDSHIISFSACNANYDGGGDSNNNSAEECTSGFLGPVVFLPTLIRQAFPPVDVVLGASTRNARRAMLACSQNSKTYTSSDTNSRSVDPDLLGNSASVGFCSIPLVPAPSAAGAEATGSALLNDMQSSATPQHIAHSHAECVITSYVPKLLHTQRFELDAGLRVTLVQLCLSWRLSRIDDLRKDAVALNDVLCEAVADGRTEQLCVPTAKERRLRAVHGMMSGAPGVALTASVALLLVAHAVLSFDPVYSATPLAARIVVLAVLVLLTLLLIVLSWMQRQHSKRSVCSEFMAFRWDKCRSGAHEMPSVNGGMEKNPLEVTHASSLNQTMGPAGDEPSAQVAMERSNHKPAERTQSNISDNTIAVPLNFPLMGSEDDRKDMKRIAGASTSTSASAAGSIASSVQQLRKSHPLIPCVLLHSPIVYHIPQSFLTPRAFIVVMEPNQEVTFVSHGAMSLLFDHGEVNSIAPGSIIGKSLSDNFTVVAQQRQQHQANDANAKDDTHNSASVSITAIGRNNIVEFHRFDMYVAEEHALPVAKSISTTTLGSTSIKVGALYLAHVSVPEGGGGEGQPSAENQQDQRGLGMRPESSDARAESGMAATVAEYHHDRVVKQLLELQDDLSAIDDASVSGSEESSAASSIRFGSSSMNASIASHTSKIGERLTSIMQNASAMLPKNVKAATKGALAAKQLSAPQLHEQLSCMHGIESVTVGKTAPRIVDIDLICLTRLIEGIAEYMGSISVQIEGKAVQSVVTTSVTSPTQRNSGGVCSSRRGSSMLLSSVVSHNSSNNTNGSSALSTQQEQQHQDQSSACGELRLSVSYDNPLDFELPKALYETLMFMCGMISYEGDTQMTLVFPLSLSRKLSSDDSRKGHNKPPQQKQVPLQAPSPKNAVPHKSINTADTLLPDASSSFRDNPWADTAERRRSMLLTLSTVSATGATVCDYALLAIVYERDYMIRESLQRILWASNIFTVCPETLEDTITIVHHVGHKVDLLFIDADADSNYKELHHRYKSLENLHVFYTSMYDRYPKEAGKDRRFRKPLNETTIFGQLSLANFNRSQMSGSERPAGGGGGGGGGANILKRQPKEILVRLGAGASGEVFQVLVPALGCYMACKRIPLEGKSLEEIQALEDEVNINTEIMHPNIVQYFYSTKTEGCLEMFMEYCNAGTVSSLIRDNELAPDAVLEIIKQTLQALAYLHSRKIVHSDLKPDNLMLKDGVVKLADFGVASRSAHGGFRGTLRYMAPEVVLQEAGGGGPASDIWSFGCIVCDLLHIAPDFRKDAALHAILAGMKSMPADYVAEMPSNMPPELREFMASCLRRNPQERAAATDLLASDFVRNGTQSEENANYVLECLTVSAQSAAHAGSDGASMNMSFLSFESGKVGSGNPSNPNLSITSRHSEKGNLLGEAMSFSTHSTGAPQMAGRPMARSMTSTARTTASAAPDSDSSGSPLSERRIPSGVGYGYGSIDGQGMPTILASSDENAPRVMHPGSKRKSQLDGSS